MEQTKGYWRDGQWIGTLVVGVLAASIPFGIFMFFYMNDANWLFFCAPIFIFLS